ncbi:hypothetical protein A3206_06365 [Candidatus Methanomassiliicoccus intestinalis]|uniref:Uncharacterized protein n=1 Tax=Methanomassiliicoccus intestinalis (strain Issoire-Mx1) TaxID=1295009 RepID=R9T4J1_METII|nr:hypothetical protein [Candidatus Methanomassiliicoccus intestinalis]AGN25847.1 hypothetical protein MMINT_04660 [Candidatus Methanomassiliicoccus intestinalis Issoire-Mx1]TQS83265.1 MAG: hypothetical protein A3206_06365 [Candidatus Methanomassiliicoccus intestinalis]
MDIVEEIIETRLVLLKKNNPGLMIDSDCMETEDGIRGLIRIIEPSTEEIVAFEFIEPEGCWYDEVTIEEYGETAEDYDVTIIVPDEEKKDASLTIEAALSRPLRVQGYNEKGKLDYSI